MSSDVMEIGFYYSFAFSKQTFRSVPEEWEISGAYICEVITVRLIQQYE